LFDLGNDLSENNDLAAQQPERVKTMQADIERWAEEVGAGKGPDQSRVKNEEKG